MEAVMDAIQIERYPAFKDSGVEWLGDIPKHWKTLANKHIFSLKKIEVGKKASEYTLLSLTLNGIIKRDMVNPQGKFPAEFNTYQEVKEGDFVFCLFDVEETPRTVGLSPYDGMITGAYTVMEPVADFDRNFLYYFYLNLDKDKRMKPLYRGLRNTIPKESFFTFKTFVPPLVEQTSIADFLDLKTAQINKAIAQKEKLIELLKERKQILIHNAVTRGLNPDVAMKDSGVEWIGEMPVEWQVLKVKFLSEVLRGKFTHRPRNDDRFYGGEYPFIQTGDISATGKYIETYSQTLNIKGYAVSKEFPKGTIVLTITGSNTGEVAILNFNACFPDSIVGFFPNNTVDVQFFYYSLYSLRNILLQSSTINTQMNLNLERVSSQFLSSPPLMEQKKIAKFIIEVEQKTSIVIQKNLAEIIKLKEYKATLINAAVTGKIKVD